MARPLEPTDAVLQDLDWVRRLARALMHDEASADDLVQDTWLRLRSTSPPADTTGRGWLTRVMLNLARDRRRRGERRARREQSAARPEALPSNDELLEAAEVRERIARWVTELQEPYRRVALLRWLEGLDASHIAKLEGVPPATIRSQIGRARRSLCERARREEGSSAPAWLAVAAGLPRPYTTAAAAVPPALPLFALMLMKTATLTLLGVAAALSILWLTQGIAPPAATAESESAERAYGSNALDAPMADVDSEVEADESRSEVLAAAVPKLATKTEVIALPATGDLRVLVVDAEGLPMGDVPVAIFEDQRYILRGASTTPEGEPAIFSGAAKRLVRGAESSPRSSYRVGLDVPGLDLTMVELDPRALPKEPVRLTMPARGSLKVHITDAKGTPITAHSHVFVTPLFESPTEPGRLQRGNRHQAPAEGLSQVVFPHVPAGTDLRVEVYDQGVLGGVQLQIKGLRPGEHRVVTLVCAETLPHVTGRVALPDGGAVGASTLKVVFTPDGSGRTEIQADGSFRLPLSRLRADPEGRFSAVLSVQIPNAAGGRGAYKVLSGRFDAVVPPPNNPQDVGIIVLRRPAVFAAGTVVDGSGKPVEGARVSLYRKFNQRSDPEDFGWNFAGIDYAYADAEGRFEVLVDEPAGEYAIRAYAKGHVDRGAVRFPSGTRNLTLVVDRERYLSGSVRFPDGVDPASCQVIAEVPNATREERTYASFSGLVDASGAFRIGGLRPATVCLTLQHGSERWEVATLSDILPELDPEAVPSALNPWDVRKKVRRIAFNVRTSGGKLAHRALVSYGKQSLTVKRGRVEALVRTAETDDVFVVAPGHLPTTLSARALPDEVHLVRGIPVRVAIESPLPALPEGAEMTVCLTSRDLDWLPWTKEEWRQGPGGRPRRTLWEEEVAVLSGETEWTLYVPSAGSYRPRWNVRHATEDVVLRGWQNEAFSTITGQYEIEVRRGLSSDARWLVQPDLEEANEAIAPTD